jgi:hypothetical protein
MKTTPRVWYLVALAAVTFAAACGGATSDSKTATPKATDSSAPAPVTTTTAAEHDMADMEHADGDDHDMADMEHADGDDHGDGTGHSDELDIMYADLPADVKAEVDVTKALVEQYPTAADATKAGWRKATISLNGIGAHYLKGGPTGFLEDYSFDAANPNVLLFDGEGPDAKIAGASFILTEPNPEGYAGDLDVFHYHYGVCFDMKTFLVIAEVDGHEGSKISMTKEQCEAKGATAFPIADLYMIHVWVAPDYIEDAPVFAHDHPKLYDGVTAESQL